MIVEERIYTLHPGKVPEYMRLYETKGYDVQRRHLPRLLGYFSTEFGPLNQVVHLWVYEDLNQRSACRSALAADPDWQFYLTQVISLVVSQENKLLVPAPFSEAVLLS